MVVREFVFVEVVGVVDWSVLVVMRGGGEGFFVGVDGLCVEGSPRGAGEVSFAFIVDDAVEGYECCYDPEEPVEIPPLAFHPYLLSQPGIREREPTI